VCFLQAVLFTDNISFLHIRNYTNAPFGLVEARSVTLIAPEGARINNIPLGVLRSMQQPTNSSSSSSSSTDAAAAAAQGDGAGIVTVTDSYVLGATNATLLPLLRRLGGQETQQPLLLLIQSNVTLVPAAWGDAWPEGGLKVLRPTIWAGSSWQMTSIDLGMAVGQVRGHAAGWSACYVYLLAQLEVEPAVSYQAASCVEGVRFVGQRPSEALADAAGVRLFGLAAAGR
jgi:hypothetical protein